MRIKREMNRLAMSAMLIVAACGQPETDQLTAERARELSERAYIYGYPLVLMHLTQQVSTNVAASEGVAAPVNQFAHLRAFPDASFREVVRPNLDTFYSIAWLDLSEGPMVLGAPAAGDRYYMLQMLDGWTNVFASPGNRTTGTEPGSWAIVGPGWSGELPDGVSRIDALTNMVWIIGRTQVNGTADYEAVHRFQDQLDLRPLSAWGDASYSPAEGVPVAPGVDKKTPPPDQVAAMDARTFFASLAELMESNPSAAADAETVAEFRAIGLVPGEGFQLPEEPEIAAAIEQGVADARRRVAETASEPGDLRDGWSYMLTGIGTYGTEYLQRAAVALFGLGANVPEDAVYPAAQADSEGAAFSGEHQYVMHFAADQLPPVKAFWSLTLYDERGYLIENPIDRYAIGDRDPLTFNDDGSLDLVIQREAPKDGESNWLPSPEGPFGLVLRTYWPEQAILDGSWSAPAVRRVD